MRLQQFINEGDYIPLLDIAQVLYKEARPFMKEMSSGKIQGAYDKWQEV